MRVSADLSACSVAGHVGALALLPTHFASALPLRATPGRKWCMSELTKLSDLQAATDGNRLDFLRTDLQLCFTFAELAKTERQIGDRDAARRVLEKAETGCATIARFLADVENPDQKNEIALKLAELRATLDTEQDCLKRPNLA
jgi:hypothetical protein